MSAVHHPLPSRFSLLVFRSKATLLQLQRTIANSAQGVAKHQQGADIAGLKMVAEHRSPLYTGEDAGELRLQLGKVQNLRRAVRHLSLVKVPAGELFSFWQQIGRATKRRGYVVGRQLHEGCIIPAVGGGLCQLSNGLYDLALKAGLEVVERHAHSQVIPGSAAAIGRDATVAWNYVDLRFRHSSDFVIDARLTHDELILSLFTIAPAVAKGIQISGFKRSEIDVKGHSCTSCGETECFRHPGAEVLREGVERTAFLVDEVWPEFQLYLRATSNQYDVLATPLDGVRWKKPQYSWNVDAPSTRLMATPETLLRAYRARKLGKYGARRLEAQLAGDAALAESFGRRLPYDVSHIVVTQSMLPFLWSGGYLGGRTFDVLMTRLPLDVLHARLDGAAKQHQGQVTLSEFRAPDDVVRAERQALEAARQIVTPHTEIASLFEGRSQLLLWVMPAATTVTPGSRILFPGPTAARKGAYELREVAKALDLEVLLVGTELEGGGFWSGVRVARADRASCLEGVAVVVQPALVEDRPRMLLKALAAGLPVIATEACGIAGLAGVHIVPFGDKPALAEKVAELTSS